MFISVHILEVSSGCHVFPGEQVDDEEPDSLYPYLHLKSTLSLYECMIF